MKEGYSDEYKCTCLAVSLVIVLFSPRLVSVLSLWMPQSGSPLESVACYAAFLALSYVVGISVESTIPYSIKDWLLYPEICRWSLPRPGCTIFTEIQNGEPGDYRFDVSEARKRYGAQIQNAQGKDSREASRYQNAEWYKLYRKHSSNASVRSNNLGHLYSRDAFALGFSTFLLSVVCNVAGMVLCGEALVSLTSLAIVGVFAAASWLSARWKAKRLVTTVIACDIASDGKE